MVEGPGEESYEILRDAYQVDSQYEQVRPCWDSDRKEVALVSQRSLTSPQGLAISSCSRFQ